LIYCLLSTKAFENKVDIDFMKRWTSGRGKK